MNNKFIKVELINKLCSALYTYPQEYDDDYVRNLIRNAYSEYDDYEKIDDVLSEHNIICLDEQTIVEVL